MTPMYLLQRFAWVLVAGISLLVALFGLIRFLAEVGEAPVRYVVQDAALFAAGVIGMALCWRRGKQLEAAREAGPRLQARGRPGKCWPWLCSGRWRQASR
jgi:hypothetical protein